MNGQLAPAQQDGFGARGVGAVEGAKGLGGPVEVKTDAAVLAGRARRHEQAGGGRQGAKTGGVEHADAGMDAIGTEAQDAVGVVDLDGPQRGLARVSAGTKQLKNVVAHLGQATRAGDGAAVGKDLVHGRVVQDEVGVVEDQLAAGRSQVIAQKGAGGTVGEGTAGAEAATGKETDHFLATRSKGETGARLVGKDDVAAQALPDKAVVAQAGAAADHHAPRLDLDAAVEGGGIVVDPGEDAVPLLDERGGNAADDAAGEGCRGVVATEGQRHVGGAASQKDGCRIAPPRQRTDALEGRRVEGIGGKVERRRARAAENQGAGVAQHIVDDRSSAIVDPADLEDAVLQGQGAGGGTAAHQHGFAGAGLGPVRGPGEWFIEQFHLINGQADIAVGRTDRLVDEDLIATEDLHDVGPGRNAGTGDRHARLEPGRRVVANQTHHARVRVDRPGNDDGGGRPRNAASGQRPNQGAGEHEHRHGQPQTGAQAVHEHRRQMVVLAIRFHAVSAEGGLESRRPQEKPPARAKQRAPEASFLLVFMALRSLG